MDDWRAFRLGISCLIVLGAGLGIWAAVGWIGAALIVAASVTFIAGYGIGYDNSCRDFGITEERRKSVRH